MERKGDEGCSALNPRRNEGEGAEEEEEVNEGGVEGSRTWV